jgi:hypothetical protein
MRPNKTNCGNSAIPYVMAWNAKHKKEGQRQGPITAAKIGY